MARARPDRLRYFFRRDSRTALTGGDVQSFLLAIGHQLARARPELFELEHLSVVIKQHIDSVGVEGRVVGIRIEDLSVSPFQRTAALELEQRIGDVAGTVSGVEIGTARLEPRLLDPDNLAHLALIGPARVLAAQDPEARIVILLDALDEIADDDTVEPRKGLLHWLARSPELPENVRVVMTSRPHSGLRLFRSAREEQLTEVVIEAGSPEVVADLRSYADRVLETDAVLAMERAKGQLSGSAKQYAVQRAAGNFLYLATYARALTDAIAQQDDELVDRLLAFSGVPGSLTGLYGFFVEMAREALTPWAGEPVGWERVGRPIVGVLTVAREPLPEDRLIALSGAPSPEKEAQRVLESLRWLLDRQDGRIAFFHPSISEFLAGREARDRHPECWVDEAEWHERIVRNYRGSAPSWADVDWTRVDRYGLAHLAAHVLKAGPRSLAEAVDLVCPGMRRAVRVEFGAESRFLELVDGVARHVADSAPVGVGLPALTYLGVVRHRVARSGATPVPRALGLMARLGRLTEALEHAAGMRPSMGQFTAVAEILRYARPGPGDPSADELRDLLVESALTVRGDGSRRDDAIEARRAAEVAARLLAPHDAERAVRLWRHGQERLEAKARPGNSLDAVYRAAAGAEQDVDKARALIDRIDGARWADYLDLAERADDVDATALLYEAERCLESAGPATHVLGLARLAAVWARHDLGTGRQLLGRVRAQVFSAGEDKELSSQLVAAARVLADTDRTTARLLLSRLDTVESNGATERAVLDGAGLWTRWGSPERARPLVDRYLAGTRSKWARLDAMKALGQSNRAEELRLVEEVHTAVTGRADPQGDPLRSLHFDGDLLGVVQRMAEYDLERAAQMAQGILQTNPFDHWPWLEGAKRPDHEIFGLDRYSALAGIGHLHVARGERAQAEAILEEMRRETERPVPLRGSAGPGAGFSSATSGAREPSADNLWDQLNMVAAQTMFNLSEEWAAYVREHFFRRPADVVRAVELGAHGTTARLVRRFAERLADRDMRRATALVRSITDPGERAIGYADLHLAAHGPIASSRHGREADAFSREVDRALGDLPRYRWTAGGALERTAGDEPGFRMRAGGREQAEDEALAYARPDHRVRFELAVRALGCREDDMRAIQGQPYLARAHRESFRAWASAVHVTLAIDDGRRDEVFEPIHWENLTADIDQSSVPARVAAAAAAYEEFRLAREVPGHTVRASHVRIEDPVYAAAVDLVTPAPGSPLSPAFARRLKEMLDAGPLPAAAELLAFAVDVRPENRDALRELAAEVVVRAEPGSATGADALSVLAVSPALGDLVEPVALLREAAGASFGWQDGASHLSDVRTRLFPVLLRSAPAVALQEFYEAASRNWSLAMSLLEHEPDALRDALGDDAVAVLGSALARGLACTSPENTAPDVVDGVRLARLVATRSAQNGQPS
ncbi:hypothetical protein [Streptomyces afghaniensis]|uniref:hypothetical protein n=1 Tax=Streptomyces afghaniensis TaxID=66865 RepID=UPI00277E59FF|nr:hypothetical protein [Streptomyces afghaniensis]MDQ1015679.1 hypothetical protein [Streptomyces afghaniensis]